MYFVFGNYIHQKCFRNMHTKYKQWLLLGKRLELIGVGRGDIVKKTFSFTPYTSTLFKVLKEYIHICF